MRLVGRACPQSSTSWDKGPAAWPRIPLCEQRANVLLLACCYQESELPCALAVRAPKGLHTEIGFGPGFAFNRTVSKDDSPYTLSASFQVMIADIWARSRWHLLAPYAQADEYRNFRPHTAGFSVNIGDQMTYEIIDDRQMLMLQPGFWINHDMTKNQSTYGPGVGLFIGGSF